MTQKRIFVRASLLILMAIFGYLAKDGFEAVREFYRLREKLVPQVAAIMFYDNTAPLPGPAHHYEYTYMVNDQTFTGEWESVFGGSARTFFSQPKEGEKLKVLYQSDDPSRSYLSFLDTNYPEFFVRALLAVVIFSLSFILCLMGIFYPDKVPL